MDILEIVKELLGNYAFPIVCCVALFWYMTKQDQRYDESIGQLRESLNNNTNVIQRLLEKLGGDR